MNPRDIKRRANAIRRAMTVEPLYDRKYKDLRVADLLLVLEDDNYHSEEVVFEALATLEYTSIVKACELEVEQDAVSNLDYDDPDRATRLDDIYKRRLKLINDIRKGE